MFAYLPLQNEDGQVHVKSGKGIGKYVEMLWWHNKNGDFNANDRTNYTVDVFGLSAAGASWTGDELIRFDGRGTDNNDDWTMGADLTVGAIKVFRAAGSQYLYTSSITFNGYTLTLSGERMTSVFLYDPTTNFHISLRNSTSSIKVTGEKHLIIVGEGSGAMHPNYIVGANFEIAHSAHTPNTSNVEVGGADGAKLTFLGPYELEMDQVNWMMDADQGTLTDPTYVTYPGCSMKGEVGSESFYHRSTSTDLPDFDMSAIEVNVGTTTGTTFQGADSAFSILGDRTFRGLRYHQSKKEDLVVTHTGDLTVDGSLTYEPGEYDNEAVSHGGLIYSCIQDHTAHAVNEPGVGVNWASFWEVVEGTASTSWVVTTVYDKVGRLTVNYTNGKTVNVKGLTSDVRVALQTGAKGKLTVNYNGASVECSDDITFYEDDLSSCIINMGGGDWSVGQESAASIDFRHVTELNDEGSTMIFDTADTVTLRPKDSDQLWPALLNKQQVDRKTIGVLGYLKCQSYTDDVTIGESLINSDIDLNNGNTIEVMNDMYIRAGFNDMDNSACIVHGNFHCDGGDLDDASTGNDFILTVTGTNVATNCGVIKNVDCSGGTELDATVGCIDGVPGSCTNVNFGS